MIIIDTNKKVPLYEQIFRELRQDILIGKMKKNTKLKPIRELAKELEVSHNTVCRAYQQLLSEGYISARQGSGYFVEELNLFNGKPLNSYLEERDEGAKQPSYKWDFHYEKFDNRVFPWSKWRKEVMNAITEESYASTISYEVNKGYYELRESICDYVNTHRGLQCTPEQIIITPGTQYAMGIIADILPQKKYNVAMEEPSYDGMRQVFLNEGWDITPIPVLESGIDANELEKTDCNLLYLTPSHQFPMGVTLSLAKRLQILEWSRRNKVYVIENDYDNEFLYGERPLLAMQSMDRNENVIYMSTLTKILTPEIRCAYLILPTHLMKVYEERYSTYYSSLALYEQRALTNFINDGYLDGQARKMSVLNARKKMIFQKTMERECPKEVTCYPVSAGTHFMVYIHGFEDQEYLISRLKLYGICIHSTTNYWYNKENRCKDMYLMGYSCISEEDMEQACMDFADALRKIKFLQRTEVI